MNIKKIGYLRVCKVFAILFTGKRIKNFPLLKFRNQQIANECNIKEIS